jgi:hypothetical protein
LRNKILRHPYAYNATRTERERRSDNEDQDPSCYGTLRASLEDCSEEDIHEWLAQLERVGLVESAPVLDNDLDFTGNFQLAAIRAEVEKLREKNEKIAQLLAR